MQIGISNDLIVGCSDVYAIQRKVSSNRIYQTWVSNGILGAHVPFTNGSAKRIEHKMNMIADGAVRITEQLINDCCLHHMQLE